ncbi:MAG: leucine-rich repeat domain-containing protein [Clostridia bacterium]|nr:leucine-rich repeat domain-containing protein [Clostridia bacterium]
MCIGVYYESGTYGDGKKYVPYMVRIADEEERENFRRFLETEGFDCRSWNPWYKGVLVNFDLKRFGLIRHPCHYECAEDRTYLREDFLEEVYVPWRMRHLSRGGEDEDNKEEEKMSEGLTYEKNAGGYAVTGLGTCSDAHVVIPETHEGFPVTEIADEAFKGSRIRGITVPGTVRRIGDVAFRYCNIIRRVEIKDLSAWCGINFDGGYSNPLFCDGAAPYVNGEKITDLYVPSGVERVERFAFPVATRLKSVHIPASVKYIGDFSFCAYGAKVYIEDLSAWCGIDFDGDYSNPLRNCSALYVGKRRVKDLVIPEGVKKISEGAFAGCRAFRSVTLPESLEEIGENAFRRCDSLIEVVNLSALDVRERDAANGFAGFGAKHITSDPGKRGRFYRDEEGFEFFECEGGRWLLGAKGRGREVVLPAGGSYGVYGHAFYGRTGLRCAKIPEGVTEIGDGAFYGCTHLNFVNLPEGVTKIGDAAFYNCRKLGEMSFPQSLASVGRGAFFSCRALKRVSFPDRLESLGDSAFALCSVLREASLPRGLSEVATYAFSGCKALKSVYVPDGVEKIGLRAFENCAKLVSVRLPEDLKAIDDHAFARCESLVSLDVPKGLEYVGEYAFDACKKLSGLNLPAGVSFIGPDAFYGCVSFTDFAVPEGVTSLERGTFYHCGNLARVTLPKSLTSIGSMAFSGCDSLERVDIPKGVTEIGSDAFCDCFSMTEITVPEGVKKLAYDVFRCCKSLTKVCLPDGVESIEEDAFVDCASLETIRIPVCVKKIHGRAFYNCEKLGKVYVPEGVEEVGEKAFARCYALKEAVLPGSLKKLGRDVFEHDDLLERIIFGGDKEEWDAVEVEYNGKKPDPGKVYFFSPGKPSGKGNFWHYGENLEILTW